METYDVQELEILDTQAFRRTLKYARAFTQLQLKEITKERGYTGWIAKMNKESRYILNAFAEAETTGRLNIREAPDDY